MVLYLLLHRCSTLSLWRFCVRWQICTRSWAARADAEQALGTQDETNILQIPRDFHAKEGTRLTEGLFLGKHISSGLQVGLQCLPLQLLLDTQYWLSHPSIASPCTGYIMSRPEPWLTYVLKNCYDHICKGYEPQMCILQGGVYSLVDQHGNAVDVVAKVSSPVSVCSLQKALLPSTPYPMQLLWLTGKYTCHLHRAWEICQACTLTGLIPVSSMLFSCITAKWPLNPYMTWWPSSTCLLDGCGHHANCHQMMCTAGGAQACPAGRG